MSRIFDALQRANLERKAAQDTDATETPEPFAIPGAEDLPPVNADVVLDNIVLYPWNPSFSSLPTLGDRGEDNSHQQRHTCGGKDLCRG